MAEASLKAAIEAASRVERLVRCQHDWAVAQETASLGGFLGRKGDYAPGPITLWRRLQRLKDIAATYFSKASKDVRDASGKPCAPL